MSPITKEFTKEQLQQIEAAAKEVLWPVVWSEKKARKHFSEKITPKVVLKLARIALASLEAEPVAFRSKLQPPTAIGSENWDYTDHRQPDAFELESCVIERLYTAPPAPVSVPDLTALNNLAGEMLNHAMNCERRVAVAYTHCAHRLAEEVRDLRAAMLQGAENAKSPTTMQTEPALDSSPKIAESTSGNSPVIPDGWVMVPVEPTEDMIVNGFESEPDESFSDEKEWEVYEAMSGCQQAAHRAKLCWAAMISAAPKI
ncbi:hypothetical protein [Enterobacter asburiae]|uniref:hypothetical protein n=1 Tax=Enterobacter asburiae TaxID=61645 RepID=UPI0020757337|nr:hypothetical protein [Enterobacter asburiae]MCM7018738.1 hypothetical protein [Enterobacter asburiae]